jgi:hypothetical protein
MGAEQRIGHAEQPADLVQRDLGTPFPLALRDPFQRDLLERGGDGEPGCHLLALLLERRVESGGDRLPRFATFFACIGKRRGRPRAEVERLLAAVISIAEAPELRATRLDDEH